MQSRGQASSRREAEAAGPVCACGDSGPGGDWAAGAGEGRGRGEDGEAWWEELGLHSHASSERDELRP